MVDFCARVWILRKAEGCVRFHFASLPLEITWAIIPVSARKFVCEGHFSHLYMSVCLSDYVNCFEETCIKPSVVSK